jgi:hypothetical protein
MEATSPGELFSALMALALSAEPGEVVSPERDHCDEDLSEVITPAEFNALMSTTTAC